MDEFTALGTTIIRGTDSEGSSEEGHGSNSTTLLLESDAEGDDAGLRSQRLSMGTTVVRFSDEEETSSDEPDSEALRGRGAGLLAVSSGSIAEMSQDMLPQRNTSKSSPNLPVNSLSLPQLPPLPHQPSTEAPPPESLSPKSAHLQRNLTSSFLSIVVKYSVAHSDQIVGPHVGGLAFCKLLSKMSRSSSSSSEARARLQRRILLKSPLQILAAREQARQLPHQQCSAREYCDDLRRRFALNKQCVRLSYSIR